MADAQQGQYYTGNGDYSTGGFDTNGNYIGGGASFDGNGNYVGKTELPGDPNAPIAGNPNPGGDSGTNMYTHASDLGPPQYTGNQGTFVPSPRAGIDDRRWGNVMQPSAFTYGQEIGADKSEEQRYADMAAAADNRLGAQINTGQFNADRTLDMNSRANEGAALGLDAAAANGRAPSVAQNQMQLGLLQAQQNNANALQQSQAAAASQAASARGGGGNLAAAQRMAQQQQGGQAAMSQQTMAQQGAQSAYQSAALRAQEMAQARGQYDQMSSNIRGQDQSRGQLGAQVATSQAQMQQQQNALNDARQATYEGRRQNVFQQQDADRQAGEAAQAGVFNAQANRDQAQSQFNQGETDKYIGMGIAAGGALFGL